MSNEVTGELKVVKKNAYEAIRALYFTGKVKPSLNKILVELESDAENLELTLLACQCLMRTKGYDMLESYADAAIKLAPESAEGYYYKGVAQQNSKGSEQEAIKNFNEALEIEPENIIYLKAKATTHLALFTDFHLPVKLAEKQRDKGEECLLKIITLVEEKEEPSYMDYFTIGEVSMMVNRNQDGKKYFIKAVSAFEACDQENIDKNIYKDIIKAQKACIKKLEKFTE